MKSIATVRTYDTNDCTATGYRFDLYPNGRISATSRSCWQGSRTLERYITEANHVDATILPGADVEAILVDATRDVDPTQWRQVSRGLIVR